MNPFTLHELQTWQAIGARFFDIGVVSFLVVLIGFGVSSIILKSTVERAVVLLSATIIGALVGDLSGSSQDSVAGQLVPALLTLIGIFGAYVFGHENGRNSHAVINVAILCFVIALSICYAYASVSKKDFSVFIFCREKYSDPSVISDDKAFERFNTQFSTYCGDVFRRYTGS